MQNDRRMLNWPVARLDYWRWHGILNLGAKQFVAMVLWSSTILEHDPKRAAEYVPWREDNGNKLLGYFNR